jgi:phosphate transport system substrate-binding protein
MHLSAVATLLLMPKKERRKDVSRKRYIAFGSVIAAVSIVLATVGAHSAPARSNGSKLVGAGATFPYPLISKWIPAYKKATGVQINYSPVGSGAGINAITNRTVDFGASDAPLTSDQFRAAKGVVQIPWALSATSIPYNIDGVSYGLKLTGPILADIYLGKIKRWNDRRIARLNSGVRLPSQKITPIYRSDGSGTTYNFTDYLSSVSREFKNKVGNGTQVNFPTGIGARGSTGVAGVLSRTDGGITYVDVAYSLKNKFKIAKIRNKAGRFALPGMRGIAAAAATIKRVPRSNEMHIVNPPATQARAYPICTFTYALAPLKSSKAPDLRRFVNWTVTAGQRYAPPLLFYPLPTVVKQAAKRTLARLHK